MLSIQFLKQKLFKLDSSLIKPVNIKLLDLCYEERVDADEKVQPIDPKSQLDSILKSIERGNQAEWLYLLDGQWLLEWIYFMKHPDETPPSEIYNDMVYSNAESGQIQLGGEVFLVSEEIWESFYGWYNGGPTLKWKIPFVQKSKKISSIKVREDSK